MIKINPVQNFGFRNINKLQGQKQTVNMQKIGLTADTVSFTGIKKANETKAREAREYNSAELRMEEIKSDAEKIIKKAESLKEEAETRFENKRRETGIIETVERYTNIAYTDSDGNEVACTFRIFPQQPKNQIQQIIINSKDGTTEKYDFVDYKKTDFEDNRTGILEYYTKYYKDKETGEDVRDEYEFDYAYLSDETVVKSADIGIRKFGNGLKSDEAVEFSNLFNLGVEPFSYAQNMTYFE